MHLPLSVSDIADLCRAGHVEASRAALVAPATLVERSARVWTTATLANAILAEGRLGV